MSRRVATSLLVVGIVLLFVFNLSLWLWTTLVDTDTFAATTTSAMTSDDSLAAIAEVTVTRLLADRPLVLAAVGDQLEAVVAGILNTDLFQRTFEELSATLHRVLTSTGVREVSFDVSRLREIVNGVAEILNRDAPSGPLAGQPDRIVLFEGRDFPKIRQLADTVPWVCVISGLLTLGIVGAVFVWANDRTVALRRFGFMLFAMALVTILLILPARSMTLSSFPTESQRIVAGNLFDAYLIRLLYQSIVLAIVGVVLIAVVVWSARARTRTVHVPVVAEPAVEPGTV